MKNAQKYLTKDGYLVKVGDTVYGWADARPAKIHSQMLDLNGEQDRVYTDKGKSNIFVRSYYRLKSAAILDGITSLEKHCASLKEQVRGHEKTIKERRKKLIKAMKEDAGKIGMKYLTK